MELEVSTGKVTTQAADGVSKLLGWHPSLGKVVVCRVSPSGRAGEQAGILSNTGEFRALREADEDKAGEFPLTYLAASDLVIFELGRDHSGDPVSLRLGSSGKLPSRPWLQNFPRLTDLSFSRDGRWGMFVVPLPDEASGDIYLAEIGTANVKLVLRALEGHVSYSFPVPQPRSAGN